MPWPKGVPRPPHTVEKMRAAQLGVPRCAETRARISRAMKRGWREGRYLAAAERQRVYLTPVLEQAVRDTISLKRPVAAQILGVSMPIVTRWRRAVSCMDAYRTPDDPMRPVAPGGFTPPYGTSASLPGAQFNPLERAPAKVEDGRANARRSASDYQGTNTLHGQHHGVSDVQRAGQIARGSG